MLHVCYWPWLCENSTRYNRTRNFGLYGHAESKKTQKVVFRSVLRPNQISFSHGQDPTATWGAIASCEKRSPNCQLAACKGPDALADGTVRQINLRMPQLRLSKNWCRSRNRDEGQREKSDQHIPVGYARVPGVIQAYSNPQAMLHFRNRSLPLRARRERPVLSAAALAHSSRESVCFGRHPNRE